MAESVEPDDDFELGKEDEDSEESLLRYYFFRGFEYKEIILLLLKNHDWPLTVIQTMNIKNTLSMSQVFVILDNQMIGEKH